MSRANEIEELLDLRRQPVAVAFRAAAPAGVERIDEAELSGCSYWKLAAAGRTFYTEAEDHFGCPVGAHTHHIELPAAKAEELNGLIGTMVELKYLSMDEVPEIPQLPGPFGVAVYSPLAESPVEPDVVLVSGNARQLMLLAEAAHAAGLSTDASPVGRPTCAAIPAVMQHGKTVTNLGCIGNRVYTDLGDDDLYFIFAGPQLSQITEQLGTIVHANTELAAFHRGRIAV